MEYIPFISLIYGLFLIALSLRFRNYSIGEFSSIVYGIFFISFGAAVYLLQVGLDLGLPVKDHRNILWFFSVMFFSTSVHVFFNNAKIIWRKTHVIEQAPDHPVS